MFLITWKETNKPRETIQHFLALFYPHVPFVQSQHQFGRVSRTCWPKKSVSERGFEGNQLSCSQANVFADFEPDLDAVGSVTWKHMLMSANEKKKKIKARTWRQLWDLFIYFPENFIGNHTALQTETLSNNTHLANHLQTSYNRIVIIKKKSRRRNKNAKRRELHTKIQ